MSASKPGQVGVQGLAKEKRASHFLAELPPEKTAARQIPAKIQLKIAAPQGPARKPTP